MSGRHGLVKGLTNYGDPEFAAYLRRSFAKSMGYSNEMLDRPIIGIAATAIASFCWSGERPESRAALVRVFKIGDLGPLSFPPGPGLLAPCC